MATRVGEISGLVGEFSKFARETADFMQERAVGLEKSMTKVMEVSGKEFATTFGEGTKLGSVFETSPRKAAFFALMSGLMASRMLKSNGSSPIPEAVPETQTRKTSKPRKKARAKAA